MDYAEDVDKTWDGSNDGNTDYGLDAFPSALAYCPIVRLMATAMAFVDDALLAVMHRAVNDAEVVANHHQVIVAAVVGHTICSEDWTHETMPMRLVAVSCVVIVDALMLDDHVLQLLRLLPIGPMKMNDAANAMDCHVSDYSVPEMVNWCDVLTTVATMQIEH